jgi:assimilatory nitrate reductase catalytic subunit
MFQAAADGEIKALWIACTNPAQSMPDQTTVRAALARAELVVVQEAFGTPATCDWAHLLLPASTWGEKTGTVTNSERCISRVRPAVPAPGEARHDWVIGVQLARRLEHTLRPGSPTLFPYDTSYADAGAERIWNEHRASTQGRDLDITGLSYALLDQHGPQQWPLPAGATQGQARLYTDGVFPTADGRARFVADVWRPVAEPRQSRFPFSLTTGRLRDQWHGMSRTGQLGRLFGHVPEPALLLHPQDMARHQWSEGQLVRVTSKRGQLLVPVRSDAGLGLSQAFMAMHWGSEVLGGHDAQGQPFAGVNALTTSAYCPTSKQPEFKHCAVRIERAELPYTLVAQAWLAPDQVEQVRAQLRALMPQFEFASCVPFSNGVALSHAAQERHGVLFRAACTQAPAPELLAHLETLLQLHGADTLRYADPQTGQHRRVKLRRTDEAGGAEVLAILLAGDTASEAWISTLLRQSLPAESWGRQLLQPGATPPGALTTASPQICSCFSVDEAAIRHCTAQLGGTPAERLAQLQNTLRCGTNCGSCVPELKRLVSLIPTRPLPATA